MSEESLELDDLEQVFLVSPTASSRAVWFTIGGCLAFAWAGLGFLIAIFARVNQLSLHAMTTLPALLGVGALATARSLARTPSQVTVGPDGLSIDDRRGTRSYAWSEIGMASVESGAMSQRKHLAIFDVAGKAIAKIGDACDDFETLTDLVQQRIAAKGDAIADRLRLQKSRRNALITGSISLIMLGVAGANVWMAREEERAARLLSEAPVPGEAEIVRRFLAPNGITPRLEYRITTADGRSGTRNAEVTRAYWEELEGATTVAVLYVADEPSICRLALGEVDEDDPTTRPGVMYVLSGVIAVICLIGLVVAALQWRGWDIEMDSRTGKLSIKRYGAGA